MNEPARQEENWPGTGRRPVLRRYGRWPGYFDRVLGGEGGGVGQPAVPERGGRRGGLVVHAGVQGLRSVAQWQDCCWLRKLLVKTWLAVYRLLLL